MHRVGLNFKKTFHRLGFPAITLEALKNPNNPLNLDDEQASWFGE
jgi:hypothetical protein